MVVFNGNFDLQKLQECLQYVQDSLDWLVASEEKEYLSQTTVFSPAMLDRTAATLNALRCRAYCLHNMRSRINRLPSGILGHILLYLGDHLLPLPFPYGTPTQDHRSRPLGLWHRASSVCRPWRREILNTLGLWTTVKVGGDAMREWATTWLSRSGALPLCLYFNTLSQGNNLDRNLQADASWLIGLGREINALYFEPHALVHSDFLISILPLIAYRLETLTVAPSLDRWTVYGSTYELPQLRTLSVWHGTLWRIWSTCELRHLSLVLQQWTAEDICGFLATLAANPRLEEVMLYEVYIDPDEWTNFSSSTEEGLSPIHMSRLRQLFIHQLDTRAIGMLALFSNRKLSLSSTCIRYHILREEAEEAEFFDYHCLYYDMRIGRDRIRPVPAKQLALATGCFVGTDGVSTWIIQRNQETSNPLECIDHAIVQELWLHTSTSSLGYSHLSTEPEITAVGKMNHVRKIVLVRNISYWLARLVPYVPELRELHILVQFKHDYQDIIYFLWQRKDAGLQVDTLHFVGDPTSDDSEAFDSWREDPSTLKSLTTNEVVFEEVRLCSKSTYEEHVSARLGMPEACKHPSPVNMLWRPWNDFATLDGSFDVSDSF